MNFILAESNDKNILTEKKFTLNIEPNDNLSLNIEPVEILINNTSFSNEVLSAYNYFSDANIERLSVKTNKKDGIHNIIYNIINILFLYNNFFLFSITCIHFRANHQRSESAIKAEQAAKEALIICERNQTTLVEINEQVLRKTSQDSWWQVVITNYSIRM
jgi:hypothetical protein